MRDTQGAAELQRAALSRGPRVGATGPRTRCCRRGKIFSCKPTVPLPMSGPCSRRLDSESPTSYPTHTAGPRVQRGPGCLTRTILGSQRRLLNSNAPSRLVPGLGTRRHKTRKIPRSGQNCSASKTPESVPLYAYVFTSNRGGSHGIYSQSRRCPVVRVLAVPGSVPRRAGG